MNDARCDATARTTLAARESYGKLLAILASSTRGARETQVGVATGRRLAALRPDLLIDNTKACPPELERPAAGIIFIRVDIRGLSKCISLAAHDDKRVRTRLPIDRPSADGHPQMKGDPDALYAAFL